MFILLRKMNGHATDSGAGGTMQANLREEAIALYVVVTW
jgi:hypothetical protein